MKEEERRNVERVEEEGKKIDGVERQKGMERRLMEEWRED